MNEEWYNDWIRMQQDPNWVGGPSSWHRKILIRSLQRSNYDIWLNQVIASYQTFLDGEDKTFSRFLLDLPSVPSDVLDLLRELCIDAEK